MVPLLIAICRDALLLYHTTDDPTIKEAILRDLHLVPNTLLRKVRGERGKAATRLANRLSSPQHSLFGYVPRPTAAAPRAAASAAASAAAYMCGQTGVAARASATRRASPGVATSWWMAISSQRQL